MINVTALSSSYLIVADQLNLNRPSFGPIEQGSFHNSYLFHFVNYHDVSDEVFSSEWSNVFTITFFFIF